MTPTGDVTDAALVAALGAPGAAGRQAWSELVTRHAGRMYAVARSFELNVATCEDLVQTAWLRLLERAHQLREPESVGVWLATIVRNEARRLVTRRRELPTALEHDDRPAPAADPDIDMLSAELRQAVRVGLSRLGDECRQLLRLLTADPRPSYDEIAAALGRPRGSLGPTRRRCLDQLRDRLPAAYRP